MIQLRLTQNADPNVLKTAKWDHELSLKQLAATQSLAVEDDALQQAKYGLNSQDWIEVLVCNRDFIGHVWISADLSILGFTRNGL